MQSSEDHLKYVGYVVEILWLGASDGIYLQNFPHLLKTRFGIEATEKDITHALGAVGPLVAETST